MLSEIMPDAPAIIHFWATWCAPCREELPEMAAFARTLETRGLGDRLVVISVDRAEFAAIDRFLSDDLGVDLATLQDPAGAVGIAFTLFGYPSTVLLDADGAVAERLPGAIQWIAPDMEARLLAHIEAE